MVVWAPQTNLQQPLSHLVLFTAALAELMKSSPVHSLILSSHLFFCPPLLLFPFTVPCKIVFAKPEDLETWPNHFSFCFMTTVRSSSYSTMVAWIFLRTFLLVILALYQMFSLRQHLIWKAYFLVFNSAVKFQYSQAYRNMKMIREHISSTFDPRDMFLSLQIGFSFVRAAAACAILERTYDLKLSPETTSPGYLKLVTDHTQLLAVYPKPPSGCHWHCLSSVWSSQHWFPSYICLLFSNYLFQHDFEWLMRLIVL